VSRDFWSAKINAPGVRPGYWRQCAAKETKKNKAAERTSFHEPFSAVARQETDGTNTKRLHNTRIKVI
jgi:hypothetical protein